MAVKKAKGVMSANWKRFRGDSEIKPCRYVGHNGKQLLAGVVDGEIILDSAGAPIPFHNIDCEWRT